MKTIRFSILLASFVSCCALHAEPVMQTFEGVTVSQPAGLAAEFPAGTPWTLDVEWDDAAMANSVDSQAANYPLVALTLTLDGQSGPWTTSAVVDVASFTLFQGNGLHEVQFTSGFDTANHTTTMIGGFDVHSINLTLTDRTENAIPALTPIPGMPFDLANFGQRFADSYLKVYLSQDGSQAIEGGLGDNPLRAPDISVRRFGGREQKSGFVLLFPPTQIRPRYESSKRLLVFNTGDDTLTFKTRISGPGRAAFSTSALLAARGASIPAGGPQEFLDLEFRPKKKLGRHTATLHILSNDPDEPDFQIRLIGRAIPPRIKPRR